MIGPFRIDPPDYAAGLSGAVDAAGADGYPPAAMALFGLPGGETNPETRLAAGYRHLAEHPLDGPLWLELAHLHAELHEFDQAFAILDELDRLGAPGLYAGLYGEDVAANRAHLLAAAGRLDEAEELARKLEGAYADSVPLRHLIASLRHAAGDFEAAVAGYGGALLELAAQVDAESEAEDFGEIDFAAIREYLEAVRLAAESGEPFAGRRPMLLADLVIFEAEEPDFGTAEPEE